MWILPIARFIGRVYRLDRSGSTEDWELSLNPGCQAKGQRLVACFLPSELLLEQTSKSGRNPLPFAAGRLSPMGNPQQASVMFAKIATMVF